MTSAADLRACGNAAFEKSQRSGLAPGLREHYLQEAQQLYNDASRLARRYRDWAEVAKCHKNIAKAGWRLAEPQQQLVYVEIERTAVDGLVLDETARKYGRQVADVVQAALCALEAARQCPVNADVATTNWRGDLVNWLEDVVVESVLEVNRSLDEHLDTRRSCLHMVAQAFGTGTNIDGTTMRGGAVINHALTEFLLNCAIRLKDATDTETVNDNDNSVDQALRKALSYVNDAFQPHERAVLFAGSDRALYDELDLAELRRRLDLQHCLLESVSIRLVADRIVHAETFENEEPSMPNIWTALDKYRTALILSRELDIENEALVTYKLAFVFQRIIKNKSAAIDHYRRVIELGNTLIPRVPQRFEWFREAVSVIQAHQQSIHVNDVNNEERERFLTLLEPELTALKEKETSTDKAFLEFVYQTHPPRNPDHRQDLDSNLSMKKKLLLACKHYHTDHLPSDTDDAKRWKYLSGEIAKLINGRYTVLKEVA